MEVVEIYKDSSYLTMGRLVLYFLLTVVGSLSAYHMWFMSQRKVKLASNIPGYTPWPLIGNLDHVLMKNPSELASFVRDQLRKFGSVTKVWIGSRLAVGLTDPRDIELILGSHVHLEKSEDYRLFEPWFGDGLLISKGEKWRTARKLIAPTFHQSILKSFMPIFNQNAAKLVKSLRKEIGTVFDVHDQMSSTTVDVLLETAMGLKGTKEERESYNYAKAVMDMCNIFHLRHYKLWLMSDFIFKWTKMAAEQTKLLGIIMSLTEKVVKIRKTEYSERKKDDSVSLYSLAVKQSEEENDKSGKEETMNFGTALKDDLDDDDTVGEKRRLAFLDFLIEASQTNNNKLSDKDIKDQVNTIMFEGHDTTAAGSSFVLCLLGVHQDIQERVHQELKDIFQGSDRPVTFQDTLSMKYLERVILESLRLYPPVPAISRTVRQDVKLASGDYTLPAGTTVGILPFVVHRDPTNWPNPEKFDPDNFLPERCVTRHHYSFIPFSAGPRSCVGRKYAMLKLKVLLSTVLRNFKVRSAVDEDEFVLQADIILKRTDGFRIMVDPR